MPQTYTKTEKGYTVFCFGGLIVLALKSEGAELCPLYRVGRKQISKKICFYHKISYDEKFPPTKTFGSSLTLSTLCLPPKTRALFDNMLVFFFK